MNRLALALVLIAFSAHALLAADPAEKWAVTGELKIVALPPELAPGLVSDLQTATTASAAQERLRDLLQAGRAVLVNWTRVATESNVRGSFATGSKLVEGIEWERPQLPIPGPRTPLKEGLRPTALEAHALGVDFQFEPTVQPGGKFIDVNLAASERRLVAWDRPPATTTLAGVQIIRALPRLAFHQTQHRLIVPSGEWVLSGTFQSTYPTKAVDLHLLRFTARRIEQR